jgi:hypothetical protein
LSLQLESGYLRFACAHHVKSDEPFIERNMAVFHHGSNRNRKILPAIAAEILTIPNFFLWIRREGMNPFFIGIPAMRTERGIGPTQAFKEFPRGLFGGVFAGDFY